jgi:hypothetical protein
LYLMRGMQGNERRQHLYFINLEEFYSESKINQYHSPRTAFIHISHTQTSS